MATDTPQDVLKRSFSPLIVGMYNAGRAVLKSNSKESKIAAYRQLGDALIAFDKAMNEDERLQAQADAERGKPAEVTNDPA